MQKLKKEEELIWPINGTLTGSIAPIPRETGNNGNERVLHIPQICRTGVSLSNGVEYYIQEPLFFSDGV